MKKRITALLLAAAVLAALTACGQKEMAETQPVDTETADAQDTDAQATDTQGAEAQAPDTQAPASEDEANAPEAPGVIDFERGSEIVEANTPGGDAETLILDEPILPDGTEQGAPQIIGMANPMVPLTNDMGFYALLGIDISIFAFPSDCEMYIIDDRIADVRCRIQTIDEEFVDITLRGTKDEDAVENLAGIYDSAMEEKEPEIYEKSDPTIEVQHSFSPANDLDIYTWDFNDTHFAMTVAGSTRDEVHDEIMDAAMCCVCAIDEY